MLYARQLRDDYEEWNMNVNTRKTQDYKQEK